MKNLKNLIVGWAFLMMFILSPIYLFAQDGGVDEINWPVWIIGIIVTVAEVVLRTIPNPKITGIIGLVINILKVISDYLNNKGALLKSK